MEEKIKGSHLEKKKGRWVKPGSYFLFLLPNAVSAREKERLKKKKKEST